MGIVSVVSVSGRDDCQLCPVPRVLHHIAHNGTRLLDDWAVVIDVCHIHSHLRQRYHITFTLRQSYYIRTTLSLLVQLGCHRAAGLQ